MATSIAKTSNATGYLGVYRHELASKYNLTKPYFARVQAAGSVYHLGSFKTAEEAARVRDRKARQLLGEWCRVNFPIDC